MLAAFSTDGERHDETTENRPKCPPKNNLKKDAHDKLRQLLEAEGEMYKQLTDVHIVSLHPYDAQVSMLPFVLSRGTQNVLELAFSSCAHP